MIALILFVEDYSKDDMEDKMQKINSKIPLLLCKEKELEDETL
jgi:hypothetical protein